MDFRTFITIEKSTTKIDYQSKILSIGSCFAVNIAQKLDYYKFQNIVNPFGILFHPLAIEKIILKALKDNPFEEEDFFKHNNLWHCFDFHSELSQKTLTDIKTTANQKLTTLKSLLKEANFFFITLGTAWVYEHKQKGLVANCHKVPQTNFSKRLLSVKEIEVSLQNILKEIRKTNPNIKIIFTISPVRHIKDGFIENQISKAHLITGLHSALSQHNDNQYFPSYEIMMDELRDYRFYADDMLHPSEVAIQYIWERFLKTYIDEKCFFDMKQIETIQKGLKHKAFSPDSDQFKIFQQNLTHKIDSIKNKFKDYGILLDF